VHEKSSHPVEIEGVVADGWSGDAAADVDLATKTERQGVDADIGRPTKGMSRGVSTTAVPDSGAGLAAFPNGDGEIDLGDGIAGFARWSRVVAEWDRREGVGRRGFDLAAEGGELKLSRDRRGQKDVPIFLHFIIFLEHIFILFWSRGRD
jgi:hypothetical protein